MREGFSNSSCRNSNRATETFSPSAWLTGCAESGSPHRGIIDSGSVSSGVPLCGLLPQDSSRGWKCDGSGGGAEQNGRPPGGCCGGSGGHCWL